MAAQHEAWSFYFFLFYGLSLLLAAVYAVLWQIVLQRMPLSAAFANKGIVVAWGLLWGFLIFGEQLTPGKLLAATLIVTGIIILGKAHE